MHSFLKAISIQGSQHSQQSSQLLIQINWMLIKNKTALVSSELSFNETVLLHENPTEAWSHCVRVVCGEVTISNHLFCFILTHTAPQSGSQDCPTNSLEETGMRSVPQQWQQVRIWMPNTA